MQILQNVPLALHSTMRLGGRAAYAAEVRSQTDVVQAVAWAEQRNLPILMIGTGSNIVWRDEGFEGLLLINKISRYETTALETGTVHITVGGGDNWDDFVAKTVDSGLAGLAFLSLIPGTAGAAPVQNIGAYGHELSDVLTAVEVFDTKTKQFATLAAKDCGFGYRTSRFKTTDRGRFLITALTVELSKELSQPPFYHALEKYFEEHQIEVFTPQAVREAVIAIRRSKLPDPAKVPNTGSFFANPIVERQQLDEILQKNPELANWPSKFMWELSDGKVKLAAGALLELAGFKGMHDEQTGMAVWPMQSLVLVNEHAKSTADLLAFRQKIMDSVKSKFGIELVQEPELLPR